MTEHVRRHEATPEPAGAGLPSESTYTGAPYDDNPTPLGTPKEAEEPAEEQAPPGMIKPAPETARRPDPLHP